MCQNCGATSWSEKHLRASGFWVTLPPMGAATRVWGWGGFDGPWFIRGLTEGPQCSWKIDLALALYFCTLYPSSKDTHTHTRSSNSTVNIISLYDRWEGSGLIENEVTNLHQYYTPIHTQLQTCMWKLTLWCTALPRMTLSVTHLLHLSVKR